MLDYHVIERSPGRQGPQSQLISSTDFEDTLSKLANHANTLINFENTLSKLANTSANFENTLSKFENTISKLANTSTNFEDS